MNSVLILAQTQETVPVWIGLLLSVLPWAILIVCIWIVAWKLLSRYQRPGMERSFQHMDSLEAKTDEMIELLKQINDKLDGPGRHA